LKEGEGEEAGGEGGEEGMDLEEGEEGGGGEKRAWLVGLNGRQRKGESLLPPFLFQYLPPYIYGGRAYFV